MPATPGSSESTLSLATRLWFAWVCFFRVLFDGSFAARAWRAREAEPALPPAAEPEEAPPARRLKAAKEGEAAEEGEARPAKAARERAAEAPQKPSVEPALQLLALMQREGRLVDFLEQDIAAFSDADVGAAARAVHEGCRKALRDHAKLAPVRAEEEGAKVTLAAGFSPAEVKLTGNVGGKPPYNGVLRHHGWRAEEISLPTPVAGHDPRVIAPAEVEL
ncbi:MAG: DUF2760 domain-containing protein [Polyangiaceae bacterium]|nr:DUF2760 domain-containing protein [Polyangiaceae bacterium]